MPRVEGVAGAVYAEQIAALFRQMPIALAVNLFNALVIAAALLFAGIRSAALLFAGSVCLVTIGRLVLWQQYRRTRPRQENAPRWARLAIAGSLLAGLCWGIGGAVLLPSVAVVAKILITVAVAGMCAGAVVVDSVCLPVFLAYLLAASLPMAIGFFAKAPPDAALGAMTVVFAGALALAGRHLSGILAEAIRLRLELGEANIRLQSEMAEHRATEAALHQAQKLEAIGQLTGGIAHDFNNLMTVIIGNLALASMRASRASPAQPRIKAAMHAAEQGAALIQRLLAFARKQHLDPRPLDLGALLAGLKELLRRTLGPEVRLDISAAPGLAPAQVDPNQLELAILNLAINARDAMPGGGTVRIVAENRDCDLDAPRELVPSGYVVLSISDSGTGMDEATLARAFEPFFTTKEIGHGSGLGLPMVQGFAAQSGGAARIRSEPGRGTIVELWLPRAETQPPTGDGQASGAEIRRGSANILLCDDDDAVRRFLGEFLQSIGYRVQEASGGEAAVGIIESGIATDLLVVDYAMPGMNGFETIRQTRSYRPDLPVLLITGYGGDLGGGAGNVPLLRKPFAPADLARRVAELVAPSRKFDT